MEISFITSSSQIIIKLKFRTPYETNHNYLGHPRNRLQSTHTNNSRFHRLINKQPLLDLSQPSRHIDGPPRNHSIPIQ